MKKIFFLAFGALMSISAWCYDNTPATFTWTVGNEAEATIPSEVADAVSQSKRTVGTALTEGKRNNLAANSGVMMVTFTPASNKPGIKAEAMVEYSIKMKKGITFTLTSIDYDALKQGTDNASYHWAYTVDGVEYSLTEVKKDEILRDNKSAPPALHHTQAIENAEAGRTVSIRFYVSGFDAGKLFCLSDLKIGGVINGEEEVRAFTNFKVDFRSEDPTWVDPTEKPANVTLSNLNYKDNQHGLQGGTITVQVDGPVKFTLGTCNWGKAISVKKDGADLASIENKGGCDGGGVGNGYNNYVTWNYNVEEAAELSFTVSGYLPYMFAEATEFVPEVTVSYFDTDGKTLVGKEVIPGNSALVYAFGEADVTVAEGEAFRGWFNGNGTTAAKVPEGTQVSEDLKLYARATDIEVVKLGAIYEYDLTKTYFYIEDHEAISSNGGGFHDGKHGWSFSNGNTLSVEVAGNALLLVGVCEESATSTTEVKDAAGNVVGVISVKKKGADDSTPDGSLQSIEYEGEATTLTLYFTATNYIHSVKVYNIAQLPKKSEAGYYEIAPGDAAGFLLALESASAGDKIFLPNGLYDLGERVLTPISKNNISIIGQSMKGTIIRNKPYYLNEGISTTATLLITGNNTYLQDLTLHNDLDYFAALAATNNGRGVCLQDRGSQTICKNVRMLSNQDTYYSNKSGSLKYFEDCEIHGTVDFICGDGSIYFKHNLLFAEKRNQNGGGQDALTANNGPDTDKGFVLEGCTIQSVCPEVSLGRAWNHTPKCTYLNTTVDYSAGEFSLSSKDGKIQRWTKELMSTETGWPIFGEYNTRTTEGELLTPSSNIVTFVEKSPKTGTMDIETVLGEEAASAFTMENTLGSWAGTASADATQAECESQWSDLEADAIYMAECEGEFVMLLKGSEVFDKLALYDGKTYMLRKANTRGGFGAPAQGGQEQAVENVEAAVKAIKMVRDGQVIIVRDGKEFTIFGNELVR